MFKRDDIVQHTVSGKQYKVEDSYSWAVYVRNVDGTGPAREGNPNNYELVVVEEAPTYSVGFDAGDTVQHVRSGKLYRVVEDPYGLDEIYIEPVLGGPARYGKPENFVLVEVPESTEIDDKCGCSDCVLEEIEETVMNKMNKMIETLRSDFGDLVSDQMQAIRDRLS